MSKVNIMLKYLLLAIGSLSFLKIQAQGQTDSLSKILKDHPTEDSVRVNLLNQLSYAYWIVDPAKAEEISREALKISEEISYLKGMATANRSIGVTSWAQGNYEEGLDVLLTALSQFQLLKDTLNIANVKMNTGLIYSEQNSADEAQRYYKETIETFQRLKKPEREVNTLNHIGELYQKQGLIKKAKEAHSNALLISSQNSYSYGKSTALSNLSTLFKESNEMDSALLYANEALNIQTNANDLNGKAFSLYNLGIIFYEKGNFKSAEAYMLLALNDAKLIGSKKLKRDIYEQLKLIAKQTGDYEKALNYAERYNALKDSLFNAEKLRDFIRLENRFELEKNEQQLKLKEQQLKLLKNDSKINALWRNFLIVSILTVVILAYFIYSRQSTNIKRKKQLLAKNKEIYEAKQALAEAELENGRLREIKLNQTIGSKNKELTSYALNFMQKNELLEDIKTSIGELKKSQNSETVKKLNTLSRLVSNSMHIDRDWKEFKRQFETVHTDFFSVLKKKYPTITNNEMKLCTLLKLNMNLKEAAQVMGISAESVKTARYRLRKKMGLGRDDNLVQHIISMEQDMS